MAKLRARSRFVVATLSWASKALVRASRSMVKGRRMCSPGSQVTSITGSPAARRRPRKSRTCHSTRLRWPAVMCVLSMKRTRCCGSETRSAGTAAAGATAAAAVLAPGELAAGDRSTTAKLVICIGLPSSSRVKSSRCNPLTGCPSLSVTYTSMLTRSTSTRSPNGMPTGAGWAVRVAAVAARVRAETARYNVRIVPSSARRRGVPRLAELERPGQEGCGGGRLVAHGDRHVLLAGLEGEIHLVLIVLAQGCERAQPRDLDRHRHLAQRRLLAVGLARDQQPHLPLERRRGLQHGHFLQRDAQAEGDGPVALPVRRHVSHLDLD